MSAVDEREALKPCPFCGEGETQVQAQTYWTGRASEVVSATVMHWCPKNPLQSLLQIKAKTEAEAIAAWNRRASAAPAQPAAAEDFVLAKRDGDMLVVTTDAEEKHYVLSLVLKRMKRPLAPGGADGGEAVTIHQFPSRSQKRGTVEHPLEVSVDGKTWKLFTCEYTAPDGELFGFEIYALDADDALARMTALRQTAIVKGELYGSEPA